MPFTTMDVVDELHRARQHFLKHIDGLTPEQWAWKPYPECKSVLETVAHLISDDRYALDALRTGEEQDYAAYNDEPVTDAPTLVARLAETHDALCAYMVERYADAPIDEQVCAYGSPMKLGGLTHLASEDYYHAGQIAFVRMAIDSGWNYYGAIYGTNL